MEKSTGELEKILGSKRDYKEFWDEEISELHFESISQFLEILVSEKGLKKGDVIRRSNLEKTYAYQIFNGTKKNPSRDKMLMLAFGMELSLNETRKLLKICRLADLYARDPRDSIIIHGISHGKNLFEVNETLHELKLPVLE